MSKTKTLTNGQADENIIRIIAYLVVLITFTGIVSHNWIPSFFLFLDFSIRAFGNSRFSLLKQLASQTAYLFRVPVKPIYAAPKKFAAGIGAALCLTIATTQFFQLESTALILSATLLGFATLESFFGICAGCYVYTFIQKLKINN